MAQDPWSWWQDSHTRIEGTDASFTSCVVNYLVMENHTHISIDMKNLNLCNAITVIWCVQLILHQMRLRMQLWLFAHQGDPTYLVVEKDRTLATYGINAVCTHLGCVVPFNTAENKFICPCHGSQYNDQGRVVRGPAPLVSSLTLVSTLAHSHTCSWWQLITNV